MSVNSIITRFRNLSLRVKVTVGIVIPLVVILGVFTWIEYQRHQETVFNNLSYLATETSQVIESGLLHDMVNRDIEGLQGMLDAIGDERAIRAVYLMDPTGRIIFSPDEKDVGIKLDNRDPTCRPCHEMEVPKRPGSVIVTLQDGQRIFRSMNPVENRPECHECHNPDQRINGLLLTDIWLAPLESPLKADLQENILWRIAAIIVAVLVVNIVMSKIVVGRVEFLSQAFDRFGQGKPDLQLINDSDDEIGKLVTSFKEMRERIRSEAAENRILSEHLQQQSTQRGEMLRRLITAQEDERKRVARELHDEFGQVLAGLSLNLESFGESVANESDPMFQPLNQTLVMIQEATERMYDLIFTLRPSVLDDLGLVPALRTYADRLLKDSSIAFEIHSANMRNRLPSEIETGLYRIYQEAMNNVIRHADAEKIWITLANHGNVFHGEISDDGKGFNPEEINTRGDSQQGLGLLGMMERVSQFDGQLEIFSNHKEGTCIRIHLPIGDKNHG